MVCRLVFPKAIILPLSFQVRVTTCLSHIINPMLHFHSGSSSLTSPFIIPPSLSIPACIGALRVERGEEGQVHRPHDPRVLERGSHHQDHRPGHLQDDQVRFLLVLPCPCVYARVRVRALTLFPICPHQTLPDAVHQAQPDPARAAGGRREEDLLSESCEGRASLLLQ